jgi:hypothetical protein
MDDDDELLMVSYQGVAPGVPVLASDGTQFGILEHVLEVPEEDVFDGIVVWTGHGGWLDRQIQRDLGRGEASAARRLELLQPQHLRFVDADRVAVITVGYIRCALNAAEATALPPPAHDTPVYYANAIDQAQDHRLYGSLFRRAHWRRDN